MKYLLDTDTFSEMAKGLNPKIVKRLDSLQIGDAAGISSGTWVEMTNDDQPAADKSTDENIQKIA